MELVLEGGVGSRRLSWLLCVKREGRKDARGLGLYGSEIGAE